MTTRAQKIVFGAYTVSSTIGEVVGYAAAADDLKITELGTSETQTQAGGGTVQRTITNPGKSASGTLVLTKAAGSSTYQTGFIGQILMITNNGDGSTRPYCVESWEEAPETDTGRRIATFTAVSEDSMVDAYLAGPVDPDTGTASNYVFGGLMAQACFFGDFAVKPVVVLTGGTVSGTGVNGSVFVDGNKWRAVFPKLNNTPGSTDWIITFFWDNGSASGSISGNDFDVSLSAIDGVFDIVLDPTSA